jgi:hypothetical protein
MPFVVYAWEERSAVKKRDAALKEIDLEVQHPFDAIVLIRSFGERKSGHIVAAPDLPSGPKPVSAAGLPAAATTVFTIDGAGEFAEFEATLDRSRNYIVYAFDYAVRAPYGFCAIAGYHRRVGQNLMETTRPIPAPRFTIRRTAAGGSERHQFVFRRPACVDGEVMSKEFALGIVAWDSPPPKPTSAPVTALAPLPENASFSARLTHTQAKIGNFADCNLPLVGKVEHCREILKANAQ